MGVTSNAACFSSESTLLNPCFGSCPATASSTAALDLNSPPPSSRASSSSSSSSPPRSEVSNNNNGSVVLLPMPAPASAANTPPVTPTAAGSTAAKKQPAPTAASPASADAEAIKQQLAATTFIQADVLTFREVVQKHTGAAEDAQDKMPVTIPARQAGGSKQNHHQQQQQNQINHQQSNQQQSTDAAGAAGGAPLGNPLRRHHVMSRLHERKQNNLRNLEVNRAGGSPFKRTGCSPRSDVSPKLVYAAGGMLPSPVTPLSSEGSFETSNPQQLQQQPQQPLTPTESIRQSLSSLHCSDDFKPNGSSAGVLERFPFLHHQNHLHNHHHHHHQQQQQHQHQQQQHHHNLIPNSSIVHTHLQLGNHHLHQQQQQQQQQQQHQIQAQHMNVYNYEQQTAMHQREPELLDLFPVHSSSSLKESSRR